MSRYLSGNHGLPKLKGNQSNTYSSKSQKIVSLNSYKEAKTICKFVNGKTAVLTLMVMIIPVVLSSSTVHAAVTPTCDKSLWQHVFLPTRLHIVNPCITATGIIKSIHVENDGDFHIKLLADNRQPNQSSKHQIREWRFSARSDMSKPSITVRSRIGL